MNTEKVEREIYNLAQSMAQCGVSLEDAIKELRDAYADALEEMAQRARSGK